MGDLAVCGLCPRVVGMWRGLAGSELCLQMCLAELYWMTVASPGFRRGLHHHTPVTEARSRNLTSLQVFCNWCCPLRSGTLIFWFSVLKSLARGC